jgi:hypothetical protein
MTKGTLFFAGWAGGSPTARRVADPYIPTADITLYARWLDLNSILTDAKARYNGAAKVIGNPDDNSPEAKAISQSIVALETAMLGTEGHRTIQTDSGPQDEIYYIYDFDMIDAASEELARLTENFSGEIIVPTMRFDYKAPGGANGNDPAQRAVLRSAGRYEIELLGGAGGHIWSTSNKTAPGGKGGYIKAEYTFTANTDVAVRVGGMGEGTAQYNGETGKYAALYGNVAARSAAKAGGYNGGGEGGASFKNGSTWWSAGMGGGGATDVRLWSEKDTALTGTTGDPRIAAAGGGGGSAQAIHNNNVGRAGGNAGGTQGSPGVIDPGAAATPQGGGPAGSVQSNGAALSGTAGKGAKGINGDGTGVEARGGGGGGWWGGGAYNQHGGANASGAGGSSWTGGASGITPTGSVVNETYQQNFWDNGWARITWKRP